MGANRRLVAVAEWQARELHLRVAREERLHDLGRGLGMRVHLDAVPDIEKQRSAFHQNAPRLAIELGLFGDEHHAEAAHHQAESLGLEGERRRVGEPPVDLALHLVPRVGEHRLADIGGDDAEIAVDALAQPLGDDAGAASELEHVAARTHRQAAHEVGGERLELRRPENAVVVLGNRAAEFRGNIHHR